MSNLCKQTFWLTYKHRGHHYRAGDGYRITSSAVANSVSGMVRPQERMLRLHMSCAGQTVPRNYCLVLAQVQGLIRMIKADQYRMRADQCEKEAAMILNPEIKGQLERIAEYWRELAHLRERYLENR